MNDCGKTLCQGSRKAQNANWMSMKRVFHHVAFDALYVSSYSLNAQYLVKAPNRPGPVQRTNTLVQTSPKLFVAGAGPVPAAVLGPDRPVIH